MASVVTSQVLLGGLEQALERLQEAAQGQQWAPVYFAAFETLNWAVVLDDHLGRPRTRHQPTDDHLSAMRFARDRVHHQWADAFELDLGVIGILGLGELGKMQLGRTAGAFPWRPVGDLPLAPPSHANPAGRAAYGRAFEGKGGSCHHRCRGGSPATNGFGLSRADPRAR